MAKHTKAPHFTDDALHFLRDLAKHNDRAWFEAHRARFEASLRDPFVRFLEDLAPRVAQVDPAFVVDAKPQGGSLARIHRDMRFAKDGKPYKTALSAHFAHKNALARLQRTAHTTTSGAVPAFFLVLEPGHCRVGAGVRTPDAAAKKKLEKAAAADARAWAKVTSAGALTRFVVTIALDDAQVSSVRFIDDVVERIKKLDPFLRVVASAVGAKT